MAENLRLDGALLPGQSLELALDGIPHDLFLLRLSWVIGDDDVASVSWIQPLNAIGQSRRVIPLPNVLLRGPGTLRAQAWNGRGSKLLADRVVGPTALISPEPQPGAQFGFAVERGDFNGDGNIDIAVGAKGQTVNGEFSRGKAWVFWGPTLSSFTPLSPSGLFDRAWYGSALSAIDIDDDGFDDLVVGAPRADYQGVIDSGLAYAYFGPNLTTVQELSQPTPEVGASFGGPIETGDFNNDGYGDVAIPSPFSSVGAIPAAGKVILFLGPDLMSTIEITRTVPASNEFFGSCLAAGKVNSDGFDDLVIGASSATSGGVLDAGDAIIAFGPSFTSRANLTNPAPQSVGRYGRDCSIGDFNGDGFPDIAISAYRAQVGPFQEAGELFVFPGPVLSGPKRFTQPIPQSQGEYGVSVASGDIDGDGVDELCVGTEFASLPGSIIRAGLVFLYENALDSNDRTYTIFDDPPQEGAIFGFSVDVADRESGSKQAGDTFSIIIGAINTTVGSKINAGRVLIFH